MKKIYIFLTILFVLPNFISAQTLNEFQWKARVLLLFTPEPENPYFQQQYRLLDQATGELLDRQVKVIFVEPSGHHENMNIFVKLAQSQFYYDLFNVEKFQFEMILIGLDGNVKYRARNAVTEADRILELIDAMPMRQRELMNRSGNTGSENTRQGKNKVRY